jgi:uncharacterized delta-60 repeat protein
LEFANKFCHKGDLMTTHKNLIGFGIRNSAQAASCVLVLLVALMTVEPRVTNGAPAADGSLDPTFGESGTVVTDISDTSNWINDIEVQPDRKIVVVGSFHDESNNIRGGALARYNADGTLDLSFGNGGKILTKAGGLRFAASLALQPDGKILVAGNADIGGNDFGLVRYNSDGTLDHSFTNNGRLIKDFSDFRTCSDMVVQPDGTILLVGSGPRAYRQASAFCIARYQSDGKIDSSFGADGIVTTIFSSGSDGTGAVALQPDGKFVLVGWADISTTISANRRPPIAVARYHSDGSLDTSFGDGGKLTLNLFASRNQANGVVIQPDGKILLAGWIRADDKEPEILATMRLNTDGALDNSFGSGGVVTNDLFGRGGEARSILLQPDGKIIVAGLAGYERAAKPKIDFAVLRYNSNGMLDESFGVGGVILTNFQRKLNFASAMAIQPDGKLVVAGYASFTNNVGTAKTDFALARYYNGNNSINPSFDSCLQDDSNGNVLQIDSRTGEYRFTACSASLILTGTGAIKVKGCKITLTHATADRNISITIKPCKHKAGGSIEALASGRTFPLSDSSTAESTCACQQTGANHRRDS